MADKEARSPSLPGNEADLYDVPKYCRDQLRAPPGWSCEAAVISAIAETGIDRMATLSMQAFSKNPLGKCSELGFSLSS
jgi:hypothetical protein